MRLIRAIVSLFALLSLTALPSASGAQVYVSITTAPSGAGLRACAGVFVCALAHAPVNRNFAALIA